MNPAEPQDHAAIEARVRELLDEGLTTEASGEILRAYGPGAFGMITAIVKDHDIAGDVFGVFTEDMLAGIHTFAWRSSLRAWVYTLARNASHRYFRDPHLRRQKSCATRDILRIEAEIRSATINYMRSSIKSKVALLRDELDPEDQTLLILRVDRDMAWRDVAIVMLGDTEDPSEEAIKTKSNALRKRFQRVKATLRARAIETGLIG